MLPRVFLSIESLCARRHVFGVERGIKCGLVCLEYLTLFEYDRDKKDVLRRPVNEEPGDEEQDAVQPVLPGLWSGDIVSP